MARLSYRQCICPSVRTWW